MWIAFFTLASPLVVFAGTAFLPDTLFAFLNVCDFAANAGDEEREWILATLSSLGRACSADWRFLLQG
jgi:hypothetical protein